MQKTPNKYWVLFFRRAMIKIASLISETNNIPALITGENVGQVASQTLSNIKVVDEISSLPILRPLAGMNKEDIINKAKNINTYNISIEPYQDCCSYFVPIHPSTKANLNIIKKLESTFDLNELYDSAIKNLEYEIIK